MADTRRNVKQTRPDTFYDIQEDSSRVAFLLLTILTLMYISFFVVGFFIVGVWLKLECGAPIFTYLWESLGASVALGGLFTLGHATVAYVRDVDTELDRLNVEGLDDDDHYHRRFSNILDELRIASGRTDLEGYVIPTQYRTALSIEDRERAVVIVSEGALGVLRRDELQAVVAHGVAHVMYGDTRIKTFLHGLVSFFEGIKELTEPTTDHRRVHVDNRGALLVLVIGLVTVVYRVLTRSLAMSVSEQREWRADATAVEYARNPEALASALYKVGWYYRNKNDLKTMQYQRFDVLSDDDYESLQIVPARVDGSQESGILAAFFRTHPPLFDRIEKLLEMTRTPFENLENQVTHKSSGHFPVEHVKNDDGVAVKDREFWVEQNGDREGPMPFSELLRGESFQPETKIATGRDSPATPLEELPLFQYLFSLREKNAMNHDCPECGGPLRTRYYLGVPLKACVICGGVGIGQNYLIRVACRYRSDEDKEEDPGLDEFREAPAPADQPEESFQLSGNCPKCDNEFTKKYYGGNTSLIVDVCSYCSYVWFEYNELQIACELA